MLVAFYVYEGQYGGLHGIYNIFIDEVNDIKEAEATAEEASRNLMDDYGITDGFEDEARDEDLIPDTEEWEEYIGDCIDENIAYEMWEIIPYGLSLYDMEKEFISDRKEFVKNHCKEIG